MSLETKKIQNSLSELKIYINSDDIFTNIDGEDLSLANLAITTGLEGTSVHVALCAEEKELLSFSLCRTDVLYLSNYLKTYLELND